MFKIVLTKESGPVDAGILGTLIRMDQHPVLWLSPPDGHQQGLQNNLCILSLLQCPANHHAGIKVNYDGKIRKPFLCLDIGDVGHPNGIDLELIGKMTLGRRKLLASLYK